MMKSFLKDEMTLKTTLLVWEPMVTSYGLVSYLQLVLIKGFDHQ
jgi:hypothetical protein